MYLEVVSNVNRLSLSHENPFSAEMAPKGAEGIFSFQQSNKQQKRKQQSFDVSVDGE